MYYYFEHKVSNWKDVTYYRIYIISNEEKIMLYVFHGYTYSWNWFTFDKNLEYFKVTQNEVFIYLLEHQYGHQMII